MQEDLNMKLLCCVTNGFEEVEFVGTIGILRRGDVDIDLFSLHDSTSTGRYGVSVTNLLNFATLDYKKYDGLFIPGGPQYLELENNPTFKEILTYFLKNNKLVAAICAGPTLIGHLGYLKGKKYTCFTAMNENFGGTYLDQYVVKDGNLITGRSAAATIDFAFEVLEFVKGKDKADEIKHQIYY